MRNPYLIDFPYIYRDDPRYADNLRWIRTNATQPKWKYNRKKGRYSPSATLIGVYLNGEDAIAYKLRFAK